MSTVTNNLLTGNQAINNYNLSKIFVFNNRFQTGSLNNSEYDPMTIPAGTVMGRIAGSNTLFPFYSRATDGSQYPIGILAADMVIVDGTTVNVPICVAGDVVKDKIVFFNPSDTLTTVVSGRTVYDRLGSDSVGIKIVDNNENTYLDNQA